MTQQSSGKVALVTGASRNIGRAIAVELARACAHVVVHVANDVSSGTGTVQAVEAVGGTASLVCGDLAAEQEVARVIEEAAGTCGRLDILVNNAAIRPEAHFSRLDFSEWKRVMAVNLDAVFLASKAVLPFLTDSPEGAIVNIGGLTGHTGAPDRAHVIASKSAIVGLTKAMAHDLSSSGITVNCVSPGLIETERNPLGSPPKHHGSRRNLLGHRGSPQDVADAVAFLCSSRARYITGETMHVNGGAYLA
ncbi:SDR family oxidoreductase [Roseibium aggregatum]|uniref:SDR family oxidoreductase n=1 Tax=Roseibium aggregatum TaxID=187304 RepID=A0A939EFS0_9HYPH|nr:SDR family oxidoreductase [Roseibium aggregatum]MBN9672079.1 SDR family oxidoreductase [Roseibium aggregatum]